MRPEQSFKRDHPSGLVVRGHRRTDEAHQVGASSFGRGRRVEVEGFGGSMGVHEMESGWVASMVVDQHRSAGEGSYRGEAEA